MEKISQKNSYCTLEMKSTWTTSKWSRQWMPAPGTPFSSFSGQCGYEAYRISFTSTPVHFFCSLLFCSCSVRSFYWVKVTHILMLTGKKSHLNAVISLFIRSLWTIETTLHFMGCIEVIYLRIFQIFHTRIY